MPGTTSAPRVVERAEGEKRFLPNGTLMRLKVGPENVGPDTARVFFVFRRATVERCFQHIGHGEGERPRPETAEHLAEERGWCRMCHGK